MLLCNSSNADNSNYDHRGIRGSTTIPHLCKRGDSRDVFTTKQFVITEQQRTSD